MPNPTKPHRALSISTVLLAVLLVFTTAVGVQAQDDPPPDFNKLSRQLSQAFQSADYAKALDIAKQMHELRPEDLETVYNIACLHCRLSHKDDAYTWLEKAVKIGFRDAEQLAGDDDFKTISAEDRFRAIVKQLRSGKAPAGKKAGKPDKPDKPKKAEEAEKPEKPKLTAEEAGARVSQIAQELVNNANSMKPEKALELSLEALELADGIDTRPLRSLANYNVACMYSRMKELDSAFKHLNKTVDLGGFGRNLAAEIKKDADFDNLREDPRYAKVLAKAGGDASPKDDAVKFKWKVTLPKDYDASEKAPLIVALHPHGGSMAACTKRWKKAASKVGAILLTPQGTHKGGDGEFHWGRDLDEIEGNVMDAINDALDEYKIDQDAIVLAGFSEGAWATWALAMRNPEVFRGIIPVAGRFVVESESYLEDEDLAKLRVFIMVGADDKDELVDANKEAAKRFKKIGAKVKLNVYEDVGHEFPPKAYKKQLKALRFILGK